MNEPPPPGSGIGGDELCNKDYGGDDSKDTPKGLSAVRASVVPGKPVDSNLVSWDGPDDMENPQNWSNARKWLVTFVCNLLTLNSTFASTAPSIAAGNIAREFGSTPEVSYLVTSAYLLGYVFGPMVWGPGSEIVGRRPTILFSLTFYTIFHLGQSFAQNMETVIITRFLTGFFACSPLTSCGAILADVWDPVNRGFATTVFSAANFMGPVLGPVVGGYITVSHLGWRWVFWVMMIWAGVCTITAILFLPETYAPVILAKKAKRMRALDPEKNKDIYAESEAVQWTLRELLNRTILRPFRMLLIEPILLLVTIYISLVYGVIYATFEAFPVIFSKRGFTIPQDGLVFIGLGIGSFLGTLVTIWFLRPYPKLLKEWRGFPPPENRLHGSMLSGPLLVFSILFLGWTGNYPSVPWYVPALSTIPLGMGNALIFMSFTNYLVDTYLMYAASAFAANAFVRSIVGAAFPLFTVQMFENMGVNWAATLIAGVSGLLAPIPFLFYKYGTRIRQKSEFAPCLDLKIAKELEQERRAAQEKEKVEV
ncbi:MFS general substrate transporter [Gloeopeniophorella convolvens]|nr:MFS general substrate transporter [Gloeopeniophorella convolvens]